VPSKQMSRYLKRAKRGRFYERGCQEKYLPADRLVGQRLLSDSQPQPP